MKLSAGVLLTCAAVAAAAPAAGAQSNGWQRLGAAPGGDAFALIGGTPYVAKDTSKGVRVWKFAGKWRKVGAPVRHAHAKFIGDASLASGPGAKPWLAWVEGPGPGGSQVRVARFSHGKWREVVGGKHPISPPHSNPNGSNEPFYSSSSPSLAFLKKRPYVAYADFDTNDTMIQVSRLDAKGLRWQRVSKGLGSPEVNDPHLALAGGRLYLEHHDRSHDAPIYDVFDATRTTWRSLPLVQSTDSAAFGGMVGFRGRLHTLFAEKPDGDVFVSSLGSDGQWNHVGPHIATDPAISPQSLATDGSTLYAAYVQTVNGVPHVDVFHLDGAAWTRFPSPTPAGSTVSSATLAGAAGGGVWLLARESTAGKTTFQLELFNAAE